MSNNFSNKPHLVYSDSSSTGSFIADFGTINQAAVVAVVTGTTGFTFTVDQGIGPVWSTGLVSATTASTGNGTITVTTSTSAFSKLRLNVTAGTTAGSPAVYLGAF